MNTTSESLEVNVENDHFDREFRALVKQCREVITSAHRMALELGNEPVELLYLNNYFNIYGKTQVNEHFDYFRRLYKRKRSSILNSLEDDTWLRTDVIIQYGEGTKISREREEQLKRVSILLSDIFVMALDLQEKATKAQEGIDPRFITPDEDITRANKILLHLLRIFYFLNEGADRQYLAKLVQTLEKQLGAPSVINAAPGLSGANLPGTAGTAGGLAGLFNMATAMMEKLGVKLPPNTIKPPNEQDIASVMNKVFNDEHTQSTMKGIIDSLQGSNDLSSALQSIVKNISDPKTLEALQGTINNSVQSSLTKSGDSSLALEKPN